MFDVFGYNFSHWKTSQGLIHLMAHGWKPSIVVLQNRKQLNVPSSKYRITPVESEILHPAQVCQMFNIPYVIMDHNYWEAQSHLGVILGARILPKRVIDTYDTGIINIHPGILPGNRGLDNLKWSIVRNLPVGVTAHLIDHRIDMGRIICTRETPVLPDDTIRDVYIRQRTDQMGVLLSAVELMAGGNTKEFIEEYCPRVTHSEKFTALPDSFDNHIEQYFNEYKAKRHLPRLSAA